MHVWLGRFAVSLTALLWLLPPAALPAGDLAAARRLFLTGHYAEAQATYEALAAVEPLPAALGAARIKRAIGEEAAAEQLLAAAWSAALHEGRRPVAAAAIAGERALLAYGRGDRAAAQQRVDEALALDPQEPRARWIAAELHTAAGRLEEAQKAYRWFFEHYNRTAKIDDPETLFYCGLGIAHYARFTRNARLFHDLVNVLYPEALKREPNFWPARWQKALLFLEKYNDAAAADEITRGLAINPHAPELHAARAALALQKYDLAAARVAVAAALAVNPRLLAARHLQADLLMADFRAAEAVPLLEDARQLNPLDDETNGRLAAAYGATDGLRDAPAETRLDRIVAAATARNPQCGIFFARLGQSLDQLRKFPQAARYYREAYERMPQLVYVRGQLGLMLMRLGEEDEARTLLQEAFAADPFNVRVKNTLAVLDLLAGYATIETEHFRIRFDRGLDEVFARHVARYLEEHIYPEVTRALGYEPPGKTLLEIFNRGRNTSGHGWFSARMVGLPYLGTVGACAGKMVAIVSPQALPRQFHWARVLRHEFVHVVNLQQTDFNVPHWFTEALAVRAEGFPRPRAWIQLLARRMAAGQVYSLATLNHGFIRPASGDDWSLAYCQAELYADYMTERFGADACHKLLAAFRDNLPTPAAIERCFSLPLEEFERGYTEHLKALAATADAAGIEMLATVPLADLQKKATQEPQNADASAQLAVGYLVRQEHAQARRHAEAARRLAPRHPLAAYVLARLQIVIGDGAAAEKLLREALDEQTPQPDALLLLAALRLRAEDFAEAERLYRLGCERFPRNDRFWKGLARVYLAADNDAALRPVLERLADGDTDDAAIPHKLTQLALAAQDYDGAARWARRTLEIDVLDAATHALLAAAERARGRANVAAEEYALAAQLKPAELAWRLAEAECWLAAGDRAQARAALDRLLAEDADFPGAMDLRKKLDEPR